MLEIEVIIDYLENTTAKVGSEDVKIFLVDNKPRPRHILPLMIICILYFIFKRNEENFAVNFRHKVRGVTFLSTNILLAVVASIQQLDKPTQTFRPGTFAIFLPILALALLLASGTVEVVKVRKGWSSWSIAIKVNLNSCGTEGRHVQSRLSEPAAPSPKKKH